MIGTVIKDQYQILELLGEGGMGVVYKALDLELGRQVALKFLKADLAGNSILIQRFRDELRTLAGFNHPNITTLFSSVTWQDQPIMVMELVEGETLRDMSDRRGPIPANVCVPLITQALAGVGSAHRKKIIHRDLKPSNLMLNTDGVVKVMDFGIAKIQNGPALTRSNVAIGTSLYMAPEQILGSPADARTDVYAMGVTLYELLAGTVPFKGDSQYAIEHAHIQQTPDPPTVHYPHIPTYIVNAVLKAMAKDPAQRFQSAEEFMAALGDGRSPVTVAETSQAGARPALDPLVTLVPPVTPTPVPIQLTNPTPTPTAEPVHVTPPPAVPADRSKMIGIALAIAAALLLLVGGIWIATQVKKEPKLEEARTMPVSSGGGGGGGRSIASALTPGQDDSGHKSSGSTPQEPFVINPTTPPVEQAPPVHPQPVESAPRDQAPPSATAPIETDGLAGQWSGSYERCEDNGRTSVAMKLTEPMPGHLTGTLRFATPEGVSGHCVLSGFVIGQGTKVTLKASQCSGSVPAYLSTDHESLLTYSGSELSGNVEPQDPCMTISLRKSGR